MSLKNFMSYDDATTVLGEYADKVNELKSGLTNLDVALSVPENTGKNVLPMTLAAIKAANTVGTWSGNAYTANDVTFTVQTDGDENVSGISANGTVPSDVWGVLFYLPSLSVKDGESYTLTGCPNGGGSNTYVLYTTDDGDNNISDFGDGITYTTNFTGNAYVRIVIYRDTTVNNVVFYPMIRPATITDSTFSPYIPSVNSRIEAVESGLTSITRSKFGNGVDLKSYNSSSNLYEMPSDGYLLGYIGNDVIELKIYGNTVSQHGAEITALLNIGLPIYCKKGMKCYVSSNTASKNIFFIPFST